MKQVAYFSSPSEKGGRIARISRHKKFGAPIPFPPTYGCARIIEVLGGIGYREIGAMGEIPITPTTLKDYCELVGFKLRKEEAVVILNLSKLYCSEVAEIKDSKTRPQAPYGYAEIKTFFDARKAKSEEAKKRKEAKEALKDKPPEDSGEQKDKKV